MGSLACALLAINNLRDLPKDLAAGKRTLAVILGDLRARAMFNTFIVLAHVTSLMMSALSGWAVLTLALLPVSLSLTRRINRGAHGVELIPLLGATGKLQMLLSTVLAITILI